MSAAPLSFSDGIPRSILKDWRKVKKLKQTGESFLQDDSCAEIGPNLQKCRECRVIRSKKGEEPAHSPVFCRFYYFRRWFIFSKSAATVSAGSKSTRVKVWSTLELLVQLTHSTFIDTRFHVCWRSLSTTLSVQRGGSCSSLLLLFFQIPCFFAVMPSHHCCAVSC